MPSTRAHGQIDIYTYINSFVPACICCSLRITTATYPVPSICAFDEIDIYTYINSFVPACICYSLRIFKTEIFTATHPVPSICDHDQIHIHTYIHSLMNTFTHSCMLQSVDHHSYQPSAFYMCPWSNRHINIH